MEVSLQSFKQRFTYDPQKDLLGKGGFGEVYKAYDTEDHIFVALKISQGTADDKYNIISEIKRFKKLNHPNIVKHIEAYEVNTGSSDIHGKPIAYHVGILEYADKGTLADLLKKGTPDYRLIEDLAKDIIEGLAYLHSENIIHRDLKPTNILLFSEGEKLRAKITDFGIAKRTDATAASTQLVGTVEYMAPEFFSTGNITPASDLWSVGVLLLEALTGTHPFGKTTQGLSNEQIINNILNKDLSTATQNLHAPFNQIITRCLLRETNLRPQSANELKGLLLRGGDAFSEKTQVIGNIPSKVNNNKFRTNFKRWGIGIIIMTTFFPIVFFVFVNKTVTKPDNSKAYKVNINTLPDKQNLEGKPLYKLDYKFDPVCNMDLNGYAAYTTKVDRFTLGFCSKDCQQEFINNPTVYITALAKELFPENWQLISVNPEVLYYYLPSSISSIDGTTRVSLKHIILSKQNRSNLSDLITKASESKNLFLLLLHSEEYLQPSDFTVTTLEFNCKKRTFKLLAFIKYDRSSKVIDSNMSMETKEGSIMPNTMFENIFKTICK